MNTLMNRDGPQVVIGFLALALAQVAVLALAVAGAANNWLGTTLLLLSAGALGATAMIFAGVRRLSRSLQVLRDEIASLAEQPLAEILVEVVRSRDATALRRRLPAVSDAGLAALTDQIEHSGATALRMAVEHEDIRLGYTEVFVNMFRRTQTLLQRQLQVIERLEQGHRTPADMHLLYQLDHLVTRMRRNSENVLVVAGTELVRTTKNPVAVADVFRAAMSEVDKYQKIRVLGTPEVRVASAAAGDLIRIVAELLDNATSFSAPDKEVTINAELGRHQGLSIGVFDNGVGMSDEHIRKANDQVRKLGSVEVARSRRVGLLVVGRLAGRHGFKVELFGGDNVVGVSVLISVPSSVLLEEDAVRATLPGDRQRSSVKANPAVAVMTSVRRSGAQRTDGGFDPAQRRMSSWYSKSKVWRTEREKTLRNLSAADDPASIDKAHADVPTELPMRVPNTRIGEPRKEARQEEEPDAVQASDQCEATGADTGGPGPRAASRWFRARGKPDDTAPAAPAASDQTWQTVEAAPRSNTYTYTEDGLPMRQQGAHLFAGDAPGATAKPDEPKEVRAIERDPARLRRRLSSYQLGVRKAMEQEDRMRGGQVRTGGWTVLERNAEK